MTVRTRVAPSPTGIPHIGTIYQAMFDYGLAKKYQGQFVLRLEDTDQVRLVEGAEEVIYKALEWFNLIPDEGPQQGGPYAPYRQSQRLDIYKQHAQELVNQNHAYYCFCTKERLEQMRQAQEKNHQPPKYDKTCLKLSADEIKQNLDNNLPHVIRMKVPANTTVKFTDTLSGDIEFDSNLIDDQVLLKSDGFATYHLAVVVDDYLMKITHIIRGKEWISSTPKHILLYQFFGWQDMIPTFTHVPLILNSDGQGKLSKRQGHASVDYYRSEGFLPEAILNYLANIVWNHPRGEEIFTFQEFIDHAFDINSPKVIDLVSQGPRFDLKKLEWVNGEHIRRLSDEQLTERLYQYLSDLTEGQPQQSKEQVAKVVPLIKERIKKLSDFIPLTDFLWEKPEYDKAVFDELSINNYQLAMRGVAEVLEKLPKPWTAQEFETAFKELATKLNLSAGQVFQLIRVMVSGQTVTPPLFESIQILGEEETLNRVQSALNFIGS